MAGVQDPRPQPPSSASPPTCHRMMWGSPGVPHPLAPAKRRKRAQGPWKGPAMRMFCPSTRAERSTSELEFPSHLMTRVLQSSWVQMVCRPSTWRVMDSTPPELSEREGRTENSTPGVWAPSP